MGGGGSNCLFPIETHITCDFPGGFRSLSTVLSPTEKRRIQGLSRPLNDIPVFVKVNLFSRTFQESLLNSTTLQACANPAFAEVWSEAICLVSMVKVQNF